MPKKQPTGIRGLEKKLTELMQDPDADRTVITMLRDKIKSLRKAVGTTPESLVEKQMKKKKALSKLGRQ